MYTGGNHIGSQDYRNNDTLSVAVESQQSAEPYYQRHCLIRSRDLSASPLAPTTDNIQQSPELSAQLHGLIVSSNAQITRDPAQAGSISLPDNLKRKPMDIAYRPDGLGQHNAPYFHHKLATPNMYDTGSRRIADTEPIWPVPRMHAQSHPVERHGPVSSTQSDSARQQNSSDYMYDSAAAGARDPVVYSQPSQPSWDPPSDYHEYPTLAYTTQRGTNQQGQYFHSQQFSSGDLNTSHGDRIARMEAGEQAGSLWPLAPNSLEAFAGIPAPSVAAARLTLPSASDQAKYKARSSLPLPKQFKCSACDAIFSRNHDLKRHARIHLAVKPFPCGYCDKAFSRKDALKRHVLVKGCGIGSKRAGEGRRRSATLSKMEHSDVGGSLSSGSGRGSRHESVMEQRSRDHLGFRDDQAQLQQGLSRSFPSKLESSSWHSNVTDTSPNDAYNGAAHTFRSGFVPLTAQGHDGSDVQDYRRGGSHPVRGPISHSQQVGHYQQYAQTYPYGHDMQSSQYQHVPGGLVNAFVAQEDPVDSSSSETQPRSVYNSAGTFESGHLGHPRDSRNSNEEAYTGTFAFPQVDGAAAAKNRHGQTSFPPRPNPSSGADQSNSNTHLRQDPGQPYFGSSLG